MRRLRLAVVSLLVLLLVPLAAACAQQLGEVAPGARVRIRAPGIVAGRYTGTVLSRTPDTLVVARSAGASVRVPVRSLTALEVSRGESRARGAALCAAWGAGIGLGIGALAAAVAESEDYGPGESAAELLVGSAIGGAIWGVIIGAIVGSERWDRYELGARTSLLVPVGSGRLGLGIRVAAGR